VSTARVDFTRGAAERIARVVRIVEQGDRGQSGPTWERVNDVTIPAGLKLATFTGDWAINTYKTVTLYGVTSTPNTASVLNLCTPAVGFSTAETSETRFVIFGKVKYTTDPVVVELQAAPTNTSCVLTLGGVDLKTIAGYSSTEIQLLGHNTTGPCLEWYSISTCGTATSTP
jgi:hypothetical protein